MASSMSSGGLPSLKTLVSVHSFAAWAALFSCARAATNYSYAYNQVAVVGGGYITGIIAHPTEPDLSYVRTDIGGAYRWDATGDRWVALNDFVAHADVDLTGTESIALDPTDPNRLYLAQGRYAATNTPKAAIFASDDRGATFKNYTPPFVMGANDMGRGNGERLAVNPFAPAELWMGTRTAGLWKSTDSAATWTNITSVPDAFANGMGIYFVLFDPATKGTVYIGGSTPGGLYVTKDGGETWEALPNQPTTWDNATLVDGLTPLSKGPQPMQAKLASNGVLYVTYADAPGPWGVTFGEVHKFATKTSTWTNITPGRANNTTPAPLAQKGHPGGWSGLSVDAADPDTLVTATLSRDPGPMIDSVYVSRDGGATWADLAQLTSAAAFPVATSKGYWAHNLSSAALADGTAVPWLGFDYGERWRALGAPDAVIGSPRFGWWMTGLLLDPSKPGRLLVATGATIWATDDVLTAAEKQTSPDWYVRAQGIEETVALSMASPTEGPANLFSGWGDMSGQRHDDLTKPQPLLADLIFSNTYSIDWAGQKPASMTRTGSNTVEQADGSCGQAAYSSDFGTSWKRFKTCPAGVNVNLTSQTTMAIDASAKHIVWSTMVSAPASDKQASNGIWSTTDLGATWTNAKGDLTKQPQYVSADRIQPATFYACDNTTFYLSTDGGASFATTATVPSCATPLVNFARAGELWLALWDDGLLHSTDFGATWAAVGPEKLFARFAAVGAADPAKGDAALVTLFLWGVPEAGAADGLYRSDDAGATWARINDEAHQYGGPQTLLGDSREYGRVYIGTNGRGILYADAVDGSGGVVPGTKGL